MTTISKVSIIAGGAGFIGVNLAKKLLSLGHVVVIGDNLSLGSKKNIEQCVSTNLDNFIHIDLSSPEGAISLLEFCLKRHGRIDEVWHLAANSDIPAGVDNPLVDLKDTFMTTFWLLDACKKFGVKKFNFASSSAVYGDWGEVPLSEVLGPLSPISNYGAMKLASEAQICAARESFLDCATIFRFPNVVGVPATHGVIYDFIYKLKKTPSHLHVLGNGSQQKSYLHVSELVKAMIFVTKHKDVESCIQPTIINIGNNDDGVTVRQIAQAVTGRCSPNSEISYEDKSYGWVGDVPRFKYDTSKLTSLGWTPVMNSTESVERAINEISIEHFDS
jgi:UDP-glucose 4-epimerase